jgi:hypothetical protein
MNDSSAQKTAKRKLIGVIVACLTGGVILLGLPILMYLKGIKASKHQLLQFRLRLTTAWQI